MNTAHNRWTRDSVGISRALSSRERHLCDAVSRWVAAKFNATNRPICALTFTCKQAIVGKSGQLVWLTPEILSDALRTFFKRIDWHVYKNASRRNSKHIERFSVIEGGCGTGKRLHVHALVLAPPRTHMNATNFIALLKSQWASSKWGMADSYFDVPESPLAAVRYLTKTGLDAIDWSNTDL